MTDISFKAYRILKELTRLKRSDLKNHCSYTVSGLRVTGWIYKDNETEYVLSLKGREFMNRDEREILKNVRALK